MNIDLEGWRSQDWVLEQDKSWENYEALKFRKLKAVTNETWGKLDEGGVLEKPMEQRASNSYPLC